MPRISVLIPCHNAARYLTAALQSACEQSPLPYEILVIDDGSTDGSGAIAEGFGSLVRCVRQENRGISDARNRGLDLAVGDLIAFLDADDVWTAESLSVRVAAMDSDPTVDCTSGLVEQFVSPELAAEIRHKLVCPAGTSGARVAGAMLVRRHVFRRVGLFDPAFKVGETLDWVARADAVGVVTRRVDSIVLRRRIHDANTTTRNSRLASDYLRVLKASLDRRRTSSPPVKD